MSTARAAERAGDKARITAERDQLRAALAQDPHVPPATLAIAGGGALALAIAVIVLAFKH